ncbi:2-C-methyl-D-erythritol 4-phosphate cytidylyltransferase [Arcticibacterium luteifluviistationis]|uniref:2-C-methyl-D-erythritol 4-phosphate cytidylyltransferase n=1 Tax=Arcticibacterium luteifluviistationis TaxID=1784714 RepID=A0A2Z4GCQ5_9BACT|nr:2-C-methyl-D-erythritol 4-phosphate cytidylyltransferase [Arcticibacterium luteifluviistationis]AWV98683.1 2-C-methyl-D-erythritol 4-phosphate cytidylyltransferase [Arcticibacterium luteifluviistationis]
MSKSIFSVIVAGGSGSRMKSVIAKQFLPLFDKPILSHTIEKFLQIPDNNIIVVLPESDMFFWEDIIQSNETLLAAVNTGQIKSVVGGVTRFQSVNNGLNAIAETTGLVAIHDGVRPLISVEKIKDSFAQAQTSDSSILAVAVKDSVRVVKENGDSKIIDRSELRLIQTPQTFNLKLIKDAYALGELPHFTDDASVFEQAGHKVNLMEGEYKNIKITTPEDLAVAEALLNK